MKTILNFVLFWLLIFSSRRTILKCVF